MSAKVDPFEELRRALDDIEKRGIVEPETKEVKDWTEALRSLTAGDTTFDVLSHEEMDAIAASTCGVALDVDRQKRTREFLRNRNIHQTVPQRSTNVTPAVIFRRDGPTNSGDRKTAMDTLERLRRQLDGEDDRTS